MKKVLMVFALLAFGFSNAQKGSILVMGSASYNASKGSNNYNDNYTKFSTIGFSPRVGYQFSESWIIGLQSNFTFFKEKSYEDQLNLFNTSKVNTVFIGPFLRYTKKLNDLFSVYADLDTGFGYGKSTFERSDNSIFTETKGSSFQTSLTPAVFLNLKNNFGLNFSFGGLSYYDGKTEYYNSDNESRNKSFNFAFGETFNVGISKNF